MALSINRQHDSFNPRIVSEKDEALESDLGANPFFLLRAEELAREAFVKGGGDESRFSVLYEAFAKINHDNLRAFFGKFWDAAATSSGTEGQESDAAFREWFAAVGPKE